MYDGACPPLVMTDDCNSGICSGEWNFESGDLTNWTDTNYGLRFTSLPGQPCNPTALPTPGLDVCAGPPNSPACPGSDCPCAGTFVYVTNNCGATGSDGRLWLGIIESEVSHLVKLVKTVSKNNY